MEMCANTSVNPGFLSSRRHVLAIWAKAAVGYHLHLCSMTPFIFGDEESVMPTLTKVFLGL